MRNICLTLVTVVIGLVSCNDHSKEHDAGQNEINPADTSSRTDTLQMNSTDSQKNAKFVEPSTEFPQRVVLEPNEKADSGKKKD